jgi:hypothetical protein
MLQEAKPHCHIGVSCEPYSYIIVWLKLLSLKQNEACVMQPKGRLRCMSAQLGKYGITRLVGGEGSLDTRNPRNPAKPYEIASLSSFRPECKAGEPSTKKEQRI